MASITLQHHRVVLEMPKLTPDKRLDHTTTQDNAIQRYLFKPWKTNSYINTVHRLLPKFGSTLPSKGAYNHRAVDKMGSSKGPPVHLKCLQNNTSLLEIPLLSHKGIWSSVSNMKSMYYRVNNYNYEEKSVTNKFLPT